MKQYLLFLALLAFTFATNTNMIMFPNNWMVSYTIDGTNIMFSLTGTNKGYVAFGVGGSAMEGIDVASFIYTTKIVSADRSYINPAISGVVDLDTNLSGTEDVMLDMSSTYDPSTGAWKIMASRPLAAKDAKDVAITDGSTLNFALALGTSQAWEKHMMATYYNVKFSSEKIADQGMSSSQLTTTALIMILFFLF